MQLRPVEAAVVVDPPLHHDVDHLCKVVQGLVTATIDSPAPQLATHLFDGVATCRRQKVGKPATSTYRRSGTKRVPQEVESLVGIGSSAILVLAVHDARLVRM